MKRFKKILFLMIILILVGGCGKKEKDIKDAKLVTDINIKSTIANHVATIEDLPKTIDLYKKDEVKPQDYDNNDIIKLGIIANVSYRNDIYLTDAEKKALTAKNITGVESYVDVNDINNSINDIWGPINIKHSETLKGCPTYIFEQNRYYIKNDCQTTQDRLISYIDKITVDGNKYYASVYVGLISNNVLYGDVNKDNKIVELDPEGSYPIDKTNKDKFSKYIYTFSKNSDGKYVFAGITK